MKRFLTSTFAALFLKTGLAVNAQDKKANVDQWPQTTQKAAKAMIDKYGEPHQQTENIPIARHTFTRILTLTNRVPLETVSKLWGTSIWFWSLFVEFILLLYELVPERE